MNSNNEPEKHFLAVAKDAEGSLQSLQETASFTYQNVHHVPLLDRFVLWLMNRSAHFISQRAHVRYEESQLSEEEKAKRGLKNWRRRYHLGIGTFGLNALTVAIAGASGMPDHQIKEFLALCTFTLIHMVALNKVVGKCLENANALSSIKRTKEEEAETAKFSAYVDELREISSWVKEENKYIGRASYKDLEKAKKLLSSLGIPTEGDFCLINVEDCSDPHLRGEYFDIQITVPAMVKVLGTAFEEANKRKAAAMVPVDAVNDNRGPSADGRTLGLTGAEVLRF